MNAPLRVGSLFSGVGGFDLGLERTGGFRTAWFCEQDEFCQHVLAERWPGVPCHPDIVQLTGDVAGPVDVLAGGFPCQDLSYAGLGAGLAGARSGLWGQYARLIGELRPRYVIVENVSALLARGLGTVLGDLASLGYDAEWDCIPAAAVGAPHRRDRVWLVAYAGGVEHQGSGDAERWPPSEGLPQDDPDADGGRLEVGGKPHGWPERSGLTAPQRRDPNGLRTTVADADSVAGPTGGALPRGRGEVLEPSALERAVGRGSGQGSAWAVEPDVGRVAHGVPARVDRLRALGNALVPQIPEWIGHRILDYERSLT